MLPFERFNTLRCGCFEAVHSVGIDIIEIGRIEGAVARWGDHFLKRIYTEKELELCRNKGEALAVRFAGKEAVMKMLGTGAKGVGWREIEILSDDRGAPLVCLHGRAHNRASELRLTDIAISLAHSREYAVASAVGERAP